MSPACARVLSAAALVGAALALSLSGHAGTAKPEILSRPALFLHVACGVFWIGSLLPLWVGLGAASSSQQELDRFSRLIPIPFAVLLASGICLVLVQLDRVDALWETRYGQVLLCKLALVAIVLALACINRYRLVPRLDGERSLVRPLRTSMAAELGFAVAILALVALWRFTPPPRALAMAAPITIHLHGERAMAEIEIMRGGSRSGGTRANVLVMDGNFQPLAAKEVTIVFANPGAGIEAVRRRGTRTAESTWRTEDLRIPVAGQWDLRVEVLVNDFEKVTLEEAVSLPRLP
jgi:copper transport protein